MSDYIKFFSELNNEDTPEVGGKNASLGEMISQLTPKGIRIPAGFATTAKAYRDFLEHNEIKGEIKEILDQLDTKDFKNLKQTGQKIRDMIMKCDFPEEMANEIKEAIANWKSGKRHLPVLP